MITIINNSLWIYSIQNKRGLLRRLQQADEVLVDLGRVQDLVEALRSACCPRRARLRAKDSYLKRKLWAQIPSIAFMSPTGTSNTPQTNVGNIQACILGAMPAIRNVVQGNVNQALTGADVI